jgi:energy-coupling factor transporter ATP-binding protein EcfA2
MLLLAIVIIMILLFPKLKDFSIFGKYPVAKIEFFIKYFIQNNSVFKNPNILNNTTQEEVFEEINNNLLNEKNCIYLISGKSGSGKTNLALQLLGSINSNELLYIPYSHKTTYCNITTKASTQKNIIDFLKKNTFKNHFLIIDNLHNFTKENLNIFSLLVAGNNRSDFFATLLILTHQIKEVSLDFKNNITDAVIKNIEPLQLSNIEESESQLYAKSEFLKNLDEFLVSDKYKNNAILNLNYIRSFNQTENSSKKFISKVHQLLINKNHDEKLLKLLGVISAISISGGVFTKKDFLRAIKFDIKSNFLTWPYYLIMHNYYLRSFIKSGLIAEVRLNDKFYIFHEKAAKFYKDKYEECDSYAISFNNGLDYKFSLMSNKDYVSKFENEIEHIDFNTPLKSNFELAVLDSNYQNLLNNIERVSKSNELLYEKSLLNEKVGNLKDAQKLLNTCIKENPDIEQYQINLIETEHDSNNEKHDKYLSSLEKLKNSENKIIKIQAEYWKEHIKMHKGIFSSNYKIYGKLIKNLKDNEDILLEVSPYYYRHILRRIYFDAYRSFYLEGSLDYDKYEALSNTLKFSEKHLKKNGNEFYAYQNKFVYAHYIHYDVLFECGIFDTMPKKYNEKLRIFKNDCQCNTKYLINKALEFYQISNDKFSVSNDKTIKYVELRIKELELAKIISNPNEDDLNNLSSIKNHYNNYLNNYAKKSGFIEFEAYSYEYLAKCYYAYGFLSYQKSKDDYTNNIKVNLLKAEGIYKKLNNQYGEFRCRFLFMLMIIKNNFNSSSINVEYSQENLLKLAIDKNYLREVRLLKYILSNEISPQDWNKFIAFYPLVLQ